MGWFVRGAFFVLALFAGVSQANAATLGTACSVDGRTQKSSTAAEGLLVCNSGTWVSITSGLTQQQASMLSALMATKTAGSACSMASGEKLSTDASNNVLVCSGGTWQMGGGGSGGSSPTPFTFTDQTNVAFNTLTCSNGISLAGMDAPAYVSVSKTGTGSPYIKVNGSGTASQTYATVQSGDSIQVCVTSANANLAGITTPVTVGSYRTNWTITTGNKIPNAFVMAAPSPNPPPSVSWVVDSTSTAAITGLTLASPVTVSATGGATVTALNIGGAGWSAYTGAQTIANNQTLGVRITTSGTPSQVHTITVSIGTGVSGGTAQTYSYTITNPAQDLTPDPFDFNSYTLSGAYWLSNTVTITGITGNVQVSTTRGEVSVAGGAWTTGPTTIQNNQTLQVRLANSAAPTVTVGTVSDVAADAAAMAGGSQFFSGNGTFYGKPITGNYRYIAVGGGGGATTNAHASGGGSGYVSIGSGAISPSVTVTVGGGGAAAPYGSSVAANDGGASSFGTHATGGGGQGGQTYGGGNGVSGGGALGGGGGSGGGNGGGGFYCGLGQGGVSLGVFVRATFGFGAGGAVGTGEVHGGGGGGGISYNGQSGNGGNGGGHDGGGFSGALYGAGGGASGNPNWGDQGGNGAAGFVYVEW